ncbi:MAG TPA: hypothetical protein VGA73_02735 [Candidatus Binatia bacterium]
MTALAAAYGFAAWKYGRDPAYLKRLALDGLAAAAVILAACGLGAAFTALTGMRPRHRLLFVPLVVLACFWALEYIRERKHPRRPK